MCVVCVLFPFFLDSRIVGRNGRPGSSEVPRNPLTRWDVSSIPANGIFLTKKLKNKIKCPTGGERLNREYTKFDFTVDEGKEWLNPSREKNKGTHRRKKVDEKSCVTFLLCDPAGTSNELDVQNEWEENTKHTPAGVTQEEG